MKNFQPLIFGFLLLYSSSTVAQNWDNEILYDGTAVSCFFNNEHDFTLDNYLTINIGRYADAYIKLVDYYTDQDVRQVYIGSKTKFSIKNIPEGKYYLKIAFGHKPQSDGSCNFRFKEKPYYYKGGSIMDFNIIKESDGYSVPSFELSLDVEVSFSSGSGFSKDVISENSFNN